MRPTPQPDSEPNLPPTLPIPLVVGLTIISGGVFLYVWSLMWAHFVKRATPASRLPALVWVNIVPGALLYLNLPSLFLASRANDLVEIARLQIAIVLWGTIAIVMMIATAIAIFAAHRHITKSMSIQT